MYALACSFVFVACLLVVLLAMFPAFLELPALPGFMRLLLLQRLENTAGRAKEICGRTPLLAAYLTAHLAEQSKN